MTPGAFMPSEFAKAVCDEMFRREIRQAELACDRRRSECKQRYAVLDALPSPAPTTQQELLTDD